LPEGFDDFAGMGAGDAPDPYAGLAPAAAAPADGPSCPSCQSPVDAAAVICINCGHNLKTGKKLKTAKVAAGVGAGAGVPGAIPEARSFGVKRVADDEPMSAGKKRAIVASVVGGIAAIVVVFVVVIAPRQKKERERLAKLDAERPRLEKAIQAMNNAGGITEAARDGSLLAANVDPEREKSLANLEDQRRKFHAEQRAASYLANADADTEPKQWITSVKNAHLQGHTHEDSVKIIEACYANGLTNLRFTHKPNTDLAGLPRVAGLIGTLPADPAARKKAFDWAATVPKTLPSPTSSDNGQKHITLEFEE
jgi:hypothetical protein